MTPAWVLEIFAEDVSVAEMLQGDRGGRGGRNASSSSGGRKPAAADEAEAEHEAEGRGLAATGRADERRGPSAPDVERDVADGRDTAEGLRDMCEGNHAWRMVWARV